MILEAVGITAAVGALGLWRLSRGPTFRAAGDLKLHRVADKVYMYRGFFSNSAVLEMPGGVVVVDTQVSPRAARRLKACIQEVTDQPITHVFNTHYHGDHTGGNAEFTDVEVIASADTLRFVHERDDERFEYTDTFGLVFQELHPTIPPNRTFEGSLALDVGEPLEVHQIGRVETPDASVVWWPRRRVIACGDGVATYHYPYLGVPFLDEGLRDDGEWTGYLRAIRSWNPEVLIPGHGPALVGRRRIHQRLDLLVALFEALLSEVKSELGKGTPIPDLIEVVDRRLARFRRRRDLGEHTVGQRFAIYRAINNLLPERAGKGWWDDLRPSVIRRVLPGPLPNEVAPRIRRLLPRRRPEAIGLLEAWLAVRAEDAEAWGLYADTLFDGARGVSPKVDATEFVRAAVRASRRGLDLDPEEPRCLLNLGCAEVFGGMILGQTMDPAIDKIERALTASLWPAQRRKALFFLGKAHDVEGHPKERDAAWRRLLPGRLGLPLVREWLRAYP